MKNILVVYNESPFLIKGEPRDILAKQGAIACARAMTQALAGRYQVQRVPIHTDVELALAPYSPTEWVVFNLGIEINCNPDLSPEAGFFQAVRRLGYSYEEMVCRIAEMALDEKRGGEAYVYNR